MAAVHVDAHSGARTVKVTRDRLRVVAAQLGVVVPRHERVIAGHQVRLLVLIVTTVPDEVGHQPGHPIAARDVRHHDRLSSSTAASMRSATRRTAASVASVSACR